MNGIFNENFVFGLVINKDRDSQERILGGLQAAQMGPNAPIGLVLMKRQSDEVARLESEVEERTRQRDAALQQVATLQNRVAGCVTLLRQSFETVTPQILPTHSQSADIHTNYDASYQAAVQQYELDVTKAFEDGFAAITTSSGTTTI